MENLMQAHKDGDLTPEEFVEEFLKIHPFEDGNGRTASILLNALEWQQKGSAGPDRMFFSMLPKFFEGE
jgi:fido (protein-threonine AMPylation protein)